MRVSRTFRASALAILVLSVVAGPFLARRALQAQAGAVPETAGGFGGDAVDASAVTQLYVQGPVTAEAAATWLKLQKRIEMPFANETPLEDMLKYLQQATLDQPAGEAAKAAPQRPMQIYVDPLALQEAEKTMTSPIVLQLEGVPVATGLHLALKQLGLSYFVQKDGIVVIKAKDYGPSDLEDPNLLILNTLAQLRTEVAELRAALAVRMGGANRPITKPQGGVQ
jgi:hypothetical protein